MFISNGRSSDFYLIQRQTSMMELVYACRSGVFIVNFEHTSHLVLVFLL